MLKFCTKHRKRVRIDRCFSISTEAIRLFKPCFLTVISALCALMILVSDNINTDPYGTFRTYAPMTENICMAFFLVFSGTLLFDLIIRNTKK